MSAALLAKLTAKGLIIDGSPMGGGIVEISAADVAASLAFGNLELWAYKYSLGKWCADAEYIKESQGEVEHLTWAHYQPKVKRVEARSISVVAMFQAVGGYLCPHCDGSKVVRIATGLVACKACRESGRGPLRLSTKADLMGMSRQGYTKTWDERVKWAESVISGWEQAGLTHMYRQFSQEEMAG